MFSPVRGVGGFRLTAMALALGILGLSERSAMAQGPGIGGGGYGYGGPAYGMPVAPSGFYGAPPVASGPGFGRFGPGYPGFGLDYGCEGCWFPHRQTMKGYSLRNWGSYVLGKECLYPYVADPYSDPAAAMGFWPPYSAPIAGGAY